MPSKCVRAPSVSFFTCVLGYAKPVCMCMVHILCVFIFYIGCVVFVVRWGFIHMRQVIAWDIYVCGSIIPVVYTLSQGVLYTRASNLVHTRTLGILYLCNGFISARWVHHIYIVPAC